MSVAVWDEGSAACVLIDSETATKDCCPGGSFIPDLPMSGGMLVVSLLVLLWIFLGVGIGADMFMTSIEVITSAERKITKTVSDGTSKIFYVKVWNDTVANLTLMALGSSCPEILLSIFEVINGEFHSGPLGPSTIVGSAAFNLMVITAVCIVAVPATETRTLGAFPVFLVTAFYSIFAYVWLLLIVIIWTPEVITIAEGVITFSMFGLLVAKAYYFDIKGKKKTSAKVVAATEAEAGSDSEKPGGRMKKEKSRAHFRREATGALIGNVALPPAPKPEDTTRAAPAPQPIQLSKSYPSVSSISPAGMIVWQKESVEFLESCGHAELVVQRVGGSEGDVSVNFHTKNQGAVAGKDYEAAEGSLTWASGDSSDKTVKIKINDDDAFEKNEAFTVVLSGPTGGATFHPEANGSKRGEAICEFVIVNDDNKVSTINFDMDSLSLAGSDWKGQLVAVVTLPEPKTPKSMILWILTLPWMALFAIVPPPGFFGGKLCFCGALCGIAFQVILISDFAVSLGCQMGLPDAAVAITFVALGTSLPDTFASMQAAKEDDTADNSVGNVTGSNSVNVLLGLGLPWLIAAVYWEGGMASPEAGAEWDRRYPSFVGREADGYPTRGFVVRSGTLGFSVLVFSSCAFLSIGVILARRQMSPPQELGGRRGPAYAAAGFLVSLWMLYIILACLSFTGKITVMQ